MTTADQLNTQQLRDVLTDCGHDGDVVASITSRAPSAYDAREVVYRVEYRDSARVNGLVFVWAEDGRLRADH